MMSTLKERLRADLTVNLKARNELETTTLRLVLGAIQFDEKAPGSKGELNDEQVQAVIAREVKKRRTTAQTWTDAGKNDRAARETAEADFLDTYRPAQLSEEDITNIIKTALTNLSDPNFGQVMKAVTPHTKGLADGRLVSDLVKNALAARPASC